MKVSHLDKIPKKKLESDTLKNAFMQVCIDEQSGWESHVLRVMTVEKDGYTPKHAHPWPHINYVISGEGTLLITDEEKVINTGSVAYVDSNTLHQFKNTGNEDLVFICIVPKEGHK